MQPKIGLSKAELNSNVTVLNQLLANEVLLYTKLRKFHWNISGNSFVELHELLEAQYHIIEKIIDEVAERISKLGAMAIGTTSEFAKHGTLKEAPGKNPDQQGMKKEILADHETIIKEIRSSIDKEEELKLDVATVDLLTKIIGDQETMAWKIRRYFGGEA